MVYLRGGSSVISVNNLNFSYSRAKVKTLKDINFNIKRGEIFGFLGPSGSGKSTTQKILIGTLKNYYGSVKIDNKELKKLKKDYYNKIGVAFESPNFYSKFTAVENLNFFGSLFSSDISDIDILLESVNLLEYKNMRVGQFSKGMKMRLNLCRALINNPDIIFLDEPTSGLDPVNAKRVKDIILQKKSEGKTVFLTTHNMNVADEICDRVAFLVDGEIKLIDSPRQLKLSRGNKNVVVEYKGDDIVETKQYSMDQLLDNQDFQRVMRTKDVERIYTQEASLESIFIEVTGRELT
ncbi:ABC transporter ATP-binding protein [Alkalicella caledoniensis]|uniref:ABC transporter ATP-binding protein n=1 Tax=Alkalicella caledoniensis TaxID=2731377 RepID=A0A7G9W5I8_ALKCA|nr:ABC transporter ATP-binding protein [Alkalicella caledoniensis]